MHPNHALIAYKKCGLINVKYKEPKILDGKTYRDLWRIPIDLETLEEM